MINAILSYINIKRIKTFKRPSSDYNNSLFELLYNHEELKNEDLDNKTKFNYHKIKSKK